MNSNEHLEQYIDLQKYWLVLRRRWLSVSIVFTGIVTLALIHAFSLDKIYEAEAKLLIKVDRSSKLTGLESSARETNSLTTESNPLATEAEILSSRNIVEKVIEDLELKDEQGKPLNYRTIADALKVLPVTGTDLLTVTYISTDPEFAAQIVNKAIEIYVENNFSSNRAETTTAREFIAKQLPKVQASVSEAEANLRKFKNQNRIASLREETTANINSISDITNQIDRIKSQLGNVEARYNRLESQLQMSWREASAISALNQSVAVQRVLDQLQEVKVSLARKSNILSDNTPQIISLREEEADLTALLNRQIAQTLGPDGQSLVSNVNILGLGELKLSQIAQFAELGLRKDGLDNELSTLEGLYESHRQKSANFPQLQEQERELERRVEAAQSTYQTLLGKLQETRIAEQQNIGNIRVVYEASVPENAIGPRKTIYVGMAGVLGILFGLGTAFLIDIKDKTIKDTYEIRQMLPYPLSGIIPEQDRITAQQHFLLPPNSTLKLPESTNTNKDNTNKDEFLLPLTREAYHNIQLNLKLLGERAENKIILVTSSSSGEGKSSVSANLAICQAQCGKKVLLIDGDLRHPVQHKLWKLPNDIGLTNIVELESDWSEVAHSIMPNLDVITSGKTCKHPISLFNSPYMDAFIIGISTYYDCIIFDTPPLVGLADSKILSKLAHGVLFVVRPGEVNYRSVMAAKELLSDLDCNILGVVANAVDLSKDPYGSDYFYADNKYLKPTITN